MIDPNLKTGAAVRKVPGCNIPPVHLNDGACQRKAQSQPVPRRILAPVKTLKQMRKIFRSEPLSLLADVDPDIERIGIVITADRSARG